jgi:hypothetical protein
VSLSRDLCFSALLVVLEVTDHMENAASKGGASKRDVTV